MGSASDPASVREADSPIRNIDFKNFLYVGPDDYSETFVLKEGEKSFVRGEEDGIQLADVKYHDLTGDGQEEAIVRMNIQTGGSAIPSLVFVYSVDQGRPVSLWKFTTGDRADGGLKSVVGENGDLIVELYGDNNLVSGKWVTTENKIMTCASCPVHFTRSVLGWNGIRFDLDKADILPVL